MVNPVPFLFACKWAEAKKAGHVREKLLMEAQGVLAMLWESTHIS